MNNPLNNSIVHFDEWEDITNAKAIDRKLDAIQKKLEKIANVEQTVADIKSDIKRLEDKLDKILSSSLTRVNRDNADVREEVLYSKYPHLGLYAYSPLFSKLLDNPILQNKEREKVDKNKADMHKADMLLAYSRLRNYKIRNHEKSKFMPDLNDNIYVEKELKNL